MYNIAIIDDHPLMRIGIKKVLSSSKYVSEIHEFENGIDFIKNINHYDFSIAYIDVFMPLLNGIDTTKIIKSINPSIKVIAFSSSFDTNSIKGMIKANADGYILKSAIKEDILDSIIVVANGGSYFSGEITEELIRLDKSNLFNDHNLDLIPLTSREKEILPFICAGLKRSYISSKLYISERTVDKHRENILSKTGSFNTTSLLIYCIQNQIITLDQIIKIHFDYLDAP